MIDVNEISDEVKRSVKNTDVKYFHIETIPEVKIYLGFKEDNGKAVYEYSLEAFREHYGQQTIQSHCRTITRQAFHRCIDYVKGFFARYVAKRASR